MAVFWRNTSLFDLSYLFFLRLTSRQLQQAILNKLLANNFPMLYYKDEKGAIAYKVG